METKAAHQETYQKGPFGWTVMCQCGWDTVCPVTKQRAHAAYEDHLSRSTKIVGVFNKKQQVVVEDKSGKWWPGVITHVLENDGYIVKFYAGGEYRLNGSCIRPEFKYRPNAGSTC